MRPGNGRCRVRRGNGTIQGPAHQTGSHGDAGRHHGLATEYTVTTGPRLFEFRGKTGMMACLWQPDSEGIVMFAGAAVKPVLRTNATWMRSVSKTSPPSLPRSPHGRNDRAHRSQRSQRRRQSGTVKPSRASNNLSGFCSPGLPSTKVLLRDWSGVEVGIPMVGTCKSLTEKVLTSVPRSNEHTEHTGGGMAADGTASHRQRRERHSVEPRGNHGPMGGAWHGGGPPPYGGIPNI